MPPTSSDDASSPPTIAAMTPMRPRSSTEKEGTVGGHGVCGSGRKLDTPGAHFAPVAVVIGLRGPDIEKRDALRGYKVEFIDADRPYVRPHTGLPVLTLKEGKPDVHRHVFGFSRR